MFAKTVLDNGIRILSEERPGARSVSLGIWVENGSRHESRHQSGISHFIEHLLFKGTERRSATQIAEEMDTVGGVLNAFTGKETTCYYAKVLDENLPLAIDLLSDLFLHSVFDGEGSSPPDGGAVLFGSRPLPLAPDHEAYSMDIRI